LETGPPALAAPAVGAEETVTVTAHEADSITLDVAAAADGLVVLSEVYSPGWKAYLDGDSVPVLVADHSLRGVPVPAGEHTLVLRYEPSSLQLGLAISLATIAALGGTTAAIAWRCRSNCHGLPGLHLTEDISVSRKSF
ncbi:MAG: YfhO family protein, partial [Thermomicrobiales bacterium]